MISTTNLLNAIFEGLVNHMDLIMTETDGRSAFSNLLDYLNEYENADDPEVLIGPEPEPNDAYRYIFYKVENPDKMGVMAGCLQATPCNLIRIKVDEGYEYYEMWKVYQG